MNVDRQALASILADTELVDYAKDPGGERDWIAALVAWEVDQSKHLDPATLAERISTIWSVGTHLVNELQGRFDIRATDSLQFPYTDAAGELQAGIVSEYRLKNISDDPRELACAIAAEVLSAAGPEHNIVLFRKLIVKTTQYSYPPTYRYETRFALAHAG